MGQCKVCGEVFAATDLKEGICKECAKGNFGNSKSDNANINEKHDKQSKNLIVWIKTQYFKAWNLLVNFLEKKWLIPLLLLWIGIVLIISYYKLSSIRSSTFSMKYDISSIKSDISSIQSSTSRMESDFSMKYNISSISSSTSSIEYDISSIKSDISSIQSDVSTIEIYVK